MRATHEDYMMSHHQMFELILQRGDLQRELMLQDVKDRLRMLITSRQYSYSGKNSIDAQKVQRY